MGFASVVPGFEGLGAWWSLPVWRLGEFHLQSRSPHWERVKPLVQLVSDWAGKLVTHSVFANASGFKRGIAAKVLGVPEVSVLFPAPFAPAMTVRAGRLTDRKRTLLPPAPQPFVSAALSYLRPGTCSQLLRHFQTIGESGDSVCLRYNRRSNPATGGRTKIRNPVRTRQD